MAVKTIGYYMEITLDLKDNGGNDIQELDPVVIEIVQKCIMSGALSEFAPLISDNNALKSATRVTQIQVHSLNRKDGGVLPMTWTEKEDKAAQEDGG